MASRPMLVIDSLAGPAGRACARRIGDEVGAVDVIDARTADLDGVDVGRYRGVVLTGSFASCYDPEPWIERLAGFLRGLEVPTLGICFGHQLIAHAFGGRVVCRPPVKRAVVDVEVVREDPLLDALPRRFRSVVSHQDHVEDVPPDFEVVATSEYTAVQAIRHRSRPIWGVQFHPDVDRHVLAVPDIGDWSDVALDDVDACESPAVLRSFSRLAP